MVSLADRLRRALAQMTNYTVKAPTVKASAGGDEAQKIADTVYAAFMRFANSPDRDKARAVVQAVSDAMARHDPATVARALIAARSKIGSEPLARVFDLLVNGRLEEALEEMARITRARRAEEIARRLGIPVEIVMEAVDEKGKVKVDLLARYVKMRAEKLLGLAETGMLTPREFREIVRDIRARVKLGSAAAGSRFLELVEKISRTSATATEPEKLVKLARAAAIGDEAALRALHEAVGRKAQASKPRPPEQARMPAQTGGEENLAAKREAERLARITGAVEKH